MSAEQRFEPRRLGWHEVQDGMVVVDKGADVWQRRGRRMHMLWDGECMCAGGLHSKGLSGNPCPPDLMLLGSFTAESASMRRLFALLLRPPARLQKGWQREDEGWRLIAERLSTESEARRV